jgi:hypothetical protein
MKKFINNYSLLLINGSTTRFVGFYERKKEVVAVADSYHAIICWNADCLRPKQCSFSVYLCVVLETVK